MNPRHVALIAAVAALALLAGVAAYLHDDGWSITYETDGGSFGSDVPCSYQEGDSFALPVPERDGFVFMGWYLDRDLTDKVDSVGGLRGDLTAHARGRHARDARRGKHEEVFYNIFFHGFDFF